MKKGQIYEGMVEKVSFPNKCVVTVEGEEKKVIVKNALPGQRIRFRLIKARKGKFEGNLLEVLESAHNELSGAQIPCIHFGFCGGCTYQHLRYEDQLALKETQIRELLAPVLAAAGSDFDVLYEGIMASPRQFEYRNKMEFSFGDTCKGGDLALGMHKRGSFYDIVTVSECRIVDRDFQKILTTTLRYFAARNISYFHKNTHEGYLRHLLVRKAVKTGEILVDLVTTTQYEAMEPGCKDADGGSDPAAIAFYHAQSRPKGMPDGEDGLLSGFADALRELELDGRIAGILHTRNDSVADVVRDEGTQVLFGESFFYEELLGLRFKISPFSFFQTNSLGAEVLYETVREFVGDLPKDSDPLSLTPEPCSVEEEHDCGSRLGGANRFFMPGPQVAGHGVSSKGAIVYDLYSGTGTIAQILAPVAKKVIGVEIVEEAVEAAKENAALNGLFNCEFLAGDVLKVLDSVAEKPDFIVLDPPRDGIHPKALEKIIRYGVERMVYVSCKPTSLARDLEVLQESGYRVKRMKCVDMFPGTVHVEVACCLQRKDS